MRSGLIAIWRRATYKSMICIRKLYLLLSLFVWFSLPVLAQTNIQSLEDEIFSSLDSLSEQSMRLNNELTQLRELVPTLKTQCSELSSSLENTHKQLSSYATSLELYKQKLQEQRKIVGLGMLILLLAVITRVVLFALKCKGVEIPYWLNTIL